MVVEWGCECDSRGNRDMWQNPAVPAESPSLPINHSVTALAAVTSKFRSSPAVSAVWWTWHQVCHCSLCCLHLVRTYLSPLDTLIKSLFYTCAVNMVWEKKEHKDESMTTSILRYKNEWMLTARAQGERELVNRDTGHGAGEDVLDLILCWTSDNWILGQNGMVVTTEAVGKLG